MSNIHKVKSTFWCKRDQFGHGSEKCFGVAETALRNNELYRVRVEGKVYSLESSKISEFRRNYIAKSGVSTHIVPLRIFELEPGQEDVVEVKKLVEEVKRPRETQGSFFGDLNVE